MSWLGEGGRAAGLSAPLSLLLHARNRQRCSPDFLNPRVVASNGGARTGRTAAIFAALVAVLVVALIGYGDIVHLQRQISASREYVSSLGPRLAVARPFASQMRFVKTFRPERVSYLKCLKDLTVSIPQGGKTYLTSFALQADMKGDCIGHSGSDQDVLDLLDKLNGIGRFNGLNRRLDARPKGNKSDVTFSIRFNYLPDN